MRTTVIPAQITTVEDKIAGNLNFTQIIILLVALFFSMITYSFLPPKFSFSLYKIILLSLTLSATVVLALRIKGKIVLDWLLILAKFNLRPGYYVYNKNDSFLRSFSAVKEQVQVKDEKLAEKAVKKITNIPAETSFIEIEEIIKNQAVSFKVGRKGGLNVAFDQIQSAGKFKKPNKN